MVEYYDAINIHKELYEWMFHFKRNSCTSSTKAECNYCATMDQNLHELRGWRNACTSWGWYFIPFLTGFSRVLYINSMSLKRWRANTNGSQFSSKQFKGTCMNNWCGVTPYVELMLFHEPFFHKITYSYILSDSFFLWRGNRVPHRMDIGERWKSFVRLLIWS